MALDEDKGAEDADVKEVEILLRGGGSSKEIPASEPSTGTRVPFVKFGYRRTSRFLMPNAVGPCKKQFAPFVFSINVTPLHVLPALLILKRSQASMQALNET
jgi:hypothetical protein